MVSIIPFLRAYVCVSFYPDLVDCRDRARAGTYFGILVVSQREKNDQRLRGHAEAPSHRRGRRRILAGPHGRLLPGTF